MDAAGLEVVGMRMLVLGDAFATVVSRLTRKVVGRVGVDVGSLTRGPVWVVAFERADAYTSLLASLQMYVH